MVWEGRGRASTPGCAAAGGAACQPVRVAEAATCCTSAVCQGLCFVCIIAVGWFLFSGQCGKDSLTVPIL